MCMHCRSLWSRINNLLVIDQYIYLGCPIATQGHSAILEKKELSNRSRTCQVKPLPPLFGTAYPLSPEYRDREDPVHRERPMLSTIDVAWEICDSGNMLPFAPTAPRGHWHGWPSDSPLPSRATLPTTWAWATGLPGSRPPGLSNWAATVLRAAAGLTIDASCDVGHASIAAYVSQISYPYGPCIPGDVGAFTLLMDLCISLIVLGSRNFAVGEEGIPISKFCCRWSASCRPWRWPGMHWEAGDVKRWKGVLYYVWSSFAFWKVV